MASVNDRQTPYPIIRGFHSSHHINQAKKISLLVTLGIIVKCQQLTRSATTTK
uniref:Uncharacterized protein n=1 Tax=Leersia perrieri TaxID=77586 RepID=A0A0D9W1F8_9ORYZ